VSGKGNYNTCDPDLGPVLRVLVNDPSGDFEILIAESEWSGHIARSNLPGCDYRICFSGGMPC